jgi:hypothetical protein
MRPLTPRTSLTAWLSTWVWVCLSPWRTSRATGSRPPRATIESGLPAGKQKPRQIPANDNRHPISSHSRPARTCGYIAATPEQANTAPVSFPIWTPPGPSGKPRFHAWGQEGPPGATQTKFGAISDARLAMRSDPAAVGRIEELAIGGDHGGVASIRSHSSSML